MTSRAEQFQQVALGPVTSGWAARSGGSGARSASISWLMGWAGWPSTAIDPVVSSSRASRAPEEPRAPGNQYVHH